MEASVAIDREICCDVCGYSRRGLGPESKCPECGEPPPKIAKSDSTINETPRTENEIFWLRSVAIGLAIFLIYSFLALQVTLIMSIGSFELAAVNFPGPKLNATTPIQRSIGGQPGEWGVAGSMATLMQVAGIWLITQRRSVRGDWESSFSLRTFARWVSILAAGGLLGLALSGSGEYLPPMGNECGTILICAILLAELPANTLIYLYLHRLAKQLESKRAVQILRVCVWIVPVLTLSAGGLIFGDLHRDKAPPAAWHFVTAAYGSIAVGTCAAATGAVLLLFSTTFAAGFGGWFNAIRERVRDYAKGDSSRIARIVSWIDRHGARWCVILGLLLWLWNLPAISQTALWRPGRTGTLGDVPMFGFVGPKVAAPLAIDEYTFAPTNETPIFVGLVAVWLITVRPTRDEPRGRRILRLAARWVAIYAVGTPAGIRMAMWSEERQRSYLLAVGVVLCEIPATSILYFYLSSLARSIKGPSRALRWMVLLSAIAGGLPMFAFVLHHYMKIDPSEIATMIAASIAIAGSLAVTLIGASAIVRLAWAMMRMHVATDSSKGAIKIGAKSIEPIHLSIAADALPADRFA